MFGPAYEARFQRFVHSAPNEPRPLAWAGMSQTFGLKNDAPGKPSARKMMTFGETFRLRTDLQANGLIHTSPGQRPGFITANSILQAESLPHNGRSGFKNGSAAAGDVPSLLSKPGAGGVELDLVGGFDRTYLLQSTTNLASPAWNLLTTLVSGQRQFTDPDAAAPKKFYRLALP